MPHVKTEEKSTYWDHQYFSGRRVNKADGTPDPELSWWSISYAEYSSEEAARKSEKPIRKGGNLKVSGSLLDSLFLNEGGTGYEMTDTKVFLALKKLLSEELSSDEAKAAEGVEGLRLAMLGVPMFNGAFVVSELVVNDD